MRAKKTFLNKEFLLDFFKSSSVSFAHDFLFDQKITRETKIRGICKEENCFNTFETVFRTLYDNKSFYCSSCLNKRRLERFTDTMLYKYGVTTSFHNPDFLQKSKKTQIERFGVSNVNKIQETRLKIKETCLKKFGVDCNLKLESCKQRIKETNMQKYGCQYTLQSELVKQKAKNTILSKYGVDHISQNPTIAEKQLKNSFRKKEFIFPSGKTVFYQGYENFAFNVLLKNNFQEDDIIIDRSLVPEIWYIDQSGKKRRHFVDIFIASEKKCVEVKSEWTITKTKDNIFYKQDAAKELGYLYEIWVFDSKGNIVEKHV
jgi:hypothetical protein